MSMKIPKILANENAVKILEFLKNYPASPSEIAEKLKMHRQTVYYYIKKLRNENLIDVFKEEKVRGFVESYYRAVDYEFFKEFKKESDSLKKFFKEFFSNGYFNGYIVVGSPESHGPFLTQSRDSHYASQISFALGRFGNQKNLIVKLDTEIKLEKLEKNNLILIGGPITNIISNEINKYLKINFGWDKNWFIQTKDKKYSDENCCLIAKTLNPFDDSKKIVLIAGLRYTGTRAGVLALTLFSDKVLNSYDHGDFYCIVKGIDKNSDGLEDDIKVLFREK